MGDDRALLARHDYRVTLGDVPVNKYHIDSGAETRQSLHLHKTNINEAIIGNHQTSTPVPPPGESVSICRIGTAFAYRIMNKTKVHNVLHC